MITPNEFTRIKNDVNGNPRYVCHFLNLDVHGCESNISLSDRYSIAVKLGNALGGRKFHNKQYGGGIVFQSYSLDELCNAINKAIQKQGANHG
jgi:ethanolamine utilization protein EutA (predicted chaperonin)